MIKKIKPNPKGCWVIKFVWSNLLFFNVGGEKLGGGKRGGGGGGGWLVGIKSPLFCCWIFPLNDFKKIFFFN